MKLTNKLNYPQSVVIAAEKSIQRPTWDNVRVSELLPGLLTKYLSIKYWDELVVDVDDLLLSMFGTSWHQYLSGWQSPNEVHNKRWYANINGVQFTGETDIYRFEEHNQSNATIEDNKTASVWSFVFGRKEWIQQLNSYAYLVQANNYPIHELYINAFLRDWSKYQAMQDRKKAYPKSQFYRIQVPLWTKEQQLEYLTKRLELHKQAQVGNVDAIVCTGGSTINGKWDEGERWERKETWAVKKKGRLSALRVADSFEQGQILAQKYKGDITIEHRKGKCVKCSDWCLVRNVCPLVKGK